MADAPRAFRAVVSWVNRDGKACINATPETWCFCGHRFKAHDRADDSFRCTVAGCACACYNLHVAQGAWHVRCRCKHAHTDHAVGEPRRPCRKRVGGKPCGCAGFDSPYVCTCDQGWAEHRTAFRRVELPAVPSDAAAAATGLSAAEAVAIREMVALPTAASVALTLADVARGRDAWGADGGGGVGAPVGGGADASHVLAPRGALASLKRRAATGRGGDAAAPAAAASASAAVAPPPAVDVSKLRPDARLEARFGNGLWYGATVTRVVSAVGEGKVAVRYDADGVEETVPAARLRPRG